MNTPDKEHEAFETWAATEWFDLQRLINGEYLLVEIESAWISWQARALLDKPSAGWQPIASAPRDGRNILIRFGQDGVSQAKYIPGLTHPWQFIDTNDGISWLINHAVDSLAGPTHWAEFPHFFSSDIAQAMRERMGEVIAVYKAKQSDTPPDTKESS